MEIDNKLNQIIETLKQETDKEIDSLEKKLKQRIFNIVVIGQFKRGKSTFINALMGKELLPSAVVPLTSIVTIIEYGDKEECLVVYQDEHIDKITIADIEKYVTEKHNPKNMLKVKEVRIYYPSQYLKNGMRIIDTPGVGSIFKHNSDVTYEYLPNSDAAIFMMSPDPPLSKAEIEFLDKAKQFIYKIFFVLNKTDLVSGEELKDVLEFNKKTLEDLLQKDINIVPISSRLALQAKKTQKQTLLDKSNISIVESDIIDKLKYKKDSYLMLSVVGSLSRLTQETIGKYELKSRTLELSYDELYKRIKHFKDMSKTVVGYKEENRFILQGRISKLIKNIDCNIEEFKDRNLEPLIFQTVTIFKENSKKTSKTEELDLLMEQNLRTTIADIFESFSQKELLSLAKEIEIIYNYIVERTNNVIIEISKSVSKMFNIEFKPLLITERFQEKYKFSLKFNDQMEAIAIMRTFVRRKLPSIFGKKAVEKHIVKVTEEIFDRHLGRVRYFLINNLQETVRRFNLELENRLDETIALIENILDESMKLKKKTKMDTKHLRSNIDNKIKILKDNSAQLKAIIDFVENNSQKINH